MSTAAEQQVVQEVVEEIIISNYEQYVILTALTYDAGGLRYCFSSSFL